MDPRSRIGTTLCGKWRIDRLLGTGGFAAVYSATHRAGRRVAIKVLHPALSASPEVRRRFLKEAYAANAVEHPGVVGVSDDDVTPDGSAFLVMDLLEGETVEARRKAQGGRVDTALALDIAEQALDALAAAHAKGIVHRDLKPENLFLTASGQVKILDFGIARFREPGEEGTSTQTGFTMGSPAFMAPEQARGKWSEVDARTDVYAIGATMFTLLSGQLVHGKGNMNETLIAAATRPAPPLASAAPHVPHAVALLVDRAIAFEQGARWPDARAMQSAVRAARQAVEGPATTLPLGVAPVAESFTLVPPTGTSHAAQGPAGIVTTSAPLVSPPAPGGSVTPEILAAPPSPERRKRGSTPIVVALLGFAACAAALTVWWAIRAPSPAADPDAIAVPNGAPSTRTDLPVVTAAGAAPASPHAQSAQSAAAADPPPAGQPAASAAAPTMAPASPGGAAGARSTAGKPTSKPNPTAAAKPEPTAAAKPGATTTGAPPKGTGGSWLDKPVLKDRH